ncbi:hypothetical protein FSBG_00114 [Fusobacterium gonidiaformans 3-1-5R]|uniref:Uncharacterized protein n=1 Tax=Fusobacterium gonidiaformans 3-1-5R TaxID=469605 RepID=E5BET6_9FUSO|nr:hypothetical protein [Fusobacterium gonidiaformans]EFS20617.1 hypothetical protein FSBG_00114 [Fusobacterium gonidiaformans 3-1-5R]
MAKNGFSSDEQRNETIKKYRNSEKGKATSRKAVAKSNSKKFIRELADEEELKELLYIMKEREDMNENLKKQIDDGIVKIEKIGEWKEADFLKIVAEASRETKKYFIQKKDERDLKSIIKNAVRDLNNREEVLNTMTLLSVKTGIYYGNFIYRIMENYEKEHNAVVAFFLELQGA